MARRSIKENRQSRDEPPIRQRILGAAFSAFMANGYAETSTLEIATRARVSKRALYELVGNKQEMLVACISERAERLAMPADLPELRDRESLARTLAAVGARLLQEISDPTVIAVFRLAIAEATRAPEVARALDSLGSEASRRALRGVMERGRSAGLLDGDPVEMAERFFGLLWGSLMLNLLLGVVERPAPRTLAERARAAAAEFLQLHPLAGDRAPDRRRAAARLKEPW